MNEAAERLSKLTEIELRKTELQRELKDLERRRLVLLNLATC